MVLQSKEGPITGLGRSRFPAALIFTGDRRVELAEELARTYLCTGDSPPCGVCIHCRKALEGIHPDIIHVGTTGENLKVDEVRALRADAYIRPNEGARKVYIVRTAETMNASGQNALLKLLEEGPPYAAFFFPVPNPELLLPTLRSRCETVRSTTIGELLPPTEEATALAGLLVEPGDPLALAAFCVALEKRSREELAALLDQTVELLVPRLVEGDGALLLSKVEALGKIRGACETTISAGHVAGWMMAALLPHRKGSGASGGGAERLI
jgi:DNA polymerase-3 subunit delta'